VNLLEKINKQVERSKLMTRGELLKEIAKAIIDTNDVFDASYDGDGYRLSWHEAMENARVAEDMRPLVMFMKGGAEYGDAWDWAQANRFYPGDRVRHHTSFGDRDGVVLSHEGASPTNPYVTLARVTLDGEMISVNVPVDKLSDA
jgi:hypothetical protein